MDTSEKFLTIVTNGISSKLLEELNPTTEQELIHELESYAKEIRAIFKKKGAKAILIKSLEAFSRIEAIEALINQKVYLNEYSNANGNKYIQARTSISKPDGKTSWLNAYVGPIEHFKLGTKDHDALKIGKELIRKKLITNQIDGNKKNI
jgi:hypothetical protein